MPRPTPTSPPRITPASVEAEVIANIKAQQLGPAAVADLGLPDAFITRVAGRILQAWFHERFRIVIDDRSAPQTPKTSSPKPATTKPAKVAIVPVQCPPQPVPADAPATPPPMRNYRAPLDGVAPFPYETPSPQAPALQQELAQLIGVNLAKDGLLLCAAKGITLLKAAVPDIDARRILEHLAAAGLPTDLLTHFRPPQVNGNLEIIEWLTKQAAGATLPRLRSTLLKTPFQFQPTAPGFVPLPDSGQVEPTQLRIQLTRGDYYAAKDDGGSLDLMRQLLETTKARLFVQVEERHLKPVLASIASWPAPFLDRIVLAPQDLPLSQWAQDSGKTGLTSSGKPATLIPRFASRAEQFSQFVPGDSCVGTSLAAAGHAVHQSPLLFQGGNLITVLDPTSGERTLLIGEAELFRNQALGLTRDQTLAAFQSEFGVNRCVVLPASAIHIDYEVTIRAHNGSLVVFVNDTRAALRIILNLGIEALAKAGRMPAPDAQEACRHVEASQARELLDLLGPVVNAAALGPGKFPLSLTDHFSTGPSDSGVGNFLRFLAALDAFAAFSPRALAAMNDPHYVAFLLAIARQERDRSALHDILKRLGWKVIPVPSLSLGDRSINALNGIHAPTTYLMPAYGGFFKALDTAAGTAISAALGPDTQVIPVLCAESQRRDGALRCSVSLMDSV